MPVPSQDLDFQRPMSGSFSMSNDLRCEVILFFLLILVEINVREYRKGNQKWTFQRNWQHKLSKTKKNKTKTQHNSVWHHYAQANTNNVNKTWAFLQTTGDKDKPNIVCIRKSLRTSQDRTQNVKMHNRTSYVLIEEATNTKLF